MFSRIARRYDLANRLLSGGTDVYWRWRLVRKVRKQGPKTMLDLATGSGDLAFALNATLNPTSENSSVEVTGMDFCQPMLDEALQKQRSYAPVHDNIRFQQGDAMALALPDNSVDAVSISFGLRNVADRHKALTEMHRVLTPGGKLYLLEFSQPWILFRPFYYFYLSYVLPRFAALITGDKQAYDYLNNTIRSYPGHKAMTGELLSAGFSSVRVTRMTFGIVALHVASK